ncbi:MAG: SDR family oxidoreductase [Clostridiales Family XIII bacterium]|jgi:3alpha(or 20beta)-hydroxysteroid dehydrogenase|nr:SDR family oxidoreductase [Clostridiales Family XIII bacterium]
MQQEKFTGRTILVTGGTSGLGKAITEGFAAEGGSVYFVGRNRDAGAAIEATLRSDGHEATFIPCDISVPDDIANAVRIAEQKTGHIDVLVNNAGIGVAGSVVSIEPERWQYALDVNLNAPFYFMREAIPAMQRNGGGNIINVSSLAGKVTIPGGAGYCATKAALIHLSKQVATDFGPDGIRCNVIVPGLFATNINAKDYEELAKEYGTDAVTFMNDTYSSMPLQKPAQPVQIYGLCSYLAGEESSYMTGAELVIDGGALTVDPMTIGMEKTKLKFASLQEE